MTTGVGEIRELRTLPDFEAVVAAGVGFLVVTDRSTPTHVHRAKCPAVQAQHFVTKVVTNGGKRGRYYHCMTLEAVQTRFRSARWCGVCHPERPA
ncbi:MAG: hypothetical protein IT460_15125 [Planctomycetes bacterium]|nr:hypothetical protein [Planctomycetota bacterium]